MSVQIWYRKFYKTPWLKIGWSYNRGRFLRILACTKYVWRASLRRAISNPLEEIVLGATLYSLVITEAVEELILRILGLHCHLADGTLQLQLELPISRKDALDSRVPRDQEPSLANIRTAKRPEWNSNARYLSANTLWYVSTEHIVVFFLQTWAPQARASAGSSRKDIRSYCVYGRKSGSSKHIFSAKPKHR